MHFRIFTPSHPATHGFLREAGESIDAALRELEEFSRTLWGVSWIIVVHERGDSVEDRAADDAAVDKIWEDVQGLPGRLDVEVIRAGHDLGIGALKHRAASEWDGNWDDLRRVLLVELDADDRLEEESLVVLERECLREAPAMIYADCAHFGDPDFVPFREDYGWVHYRGPGGIAHEQWPITPASLSSILYSPDHLRAYRADAYLEVGGHNPELAVCDDHDLTQRIFLRYGAESIRKVPRALYRYRRHAQQRTRSIGTHDIQDLSAGMWRERSESIGLRWAHDRGLNSILLGQRADDLRYSHVLDISGSPGITRQDLGSVPWPFADSSAGYVRAIHVLEHLADPMRTMAEIWRILEHGGLLEIEVPVATGIGAFADPGHRSLWTSESLAYYTDSAFATFSSGTPRGFAQCVSGDWARFQLVASAEHDMRLGGSLSGRTARVLHATLAALKPCGPRLPGPNYWR